MDKKLKLNAKLNLTICVCDFWIHATTLCNKLHGFVLQKSQKALAKEFDIMREMLKEDYPEEYKNNIKETLKMAGDSA